MGQSPTKPPPHSSATDALHIFAEDIKTSLETSEHDENREEVIQRMNEWEYIPVNIAVVGVTGSGKSSLINSIRGLKADDPDATAIGVIETTKDIRVYPHPHHKNLRLWDVPGVGSKNFTRETYLTRIQFEKYDLFLLVTSSRFHAVDLWLALTLKEAKKPVFFLRTKIDVDVYSYNLARWRPKSETEIVQIIRQDTERNLADAGMSQTKIFLISSFDTSKYDYDIFVKTLIEEAPEFKRRAIAHTLNIYSPSLIEIKLNTLKERIPEVAKASATGTVVCLRNFKASVNTDVVLKEISVYRKTFGIHDSGLKQVAQGLNISLDAWKEQLDLRCVQLSSKSGLEAFLQKVGSSAEFEKMKENSQVCDVSVPFNETCLEKILRMAADDAVIHFMSSLFLAERLKHGTPV